jgi:DNA topoisomerase II
LYRSNNKQSTVSKSLATMAYNSESESSADYMEDAASDFSDADSSFGSEKNFPPVAKAKPKAAAAVAVAKGAKKGGAVAAAAKKKKNQKQAAPPALALTASSAVLSSRSDNVEPEFVAAAKGGTKKTIEEMYQKKTQLEHILLRPDTYSKC